MSEREREKEQSNRPVDTLRDGPLKLAIFRNQSERGDFYSAVPGRIYTDEKTGEIREVSSLSGSELLRMANLLTKGYERVAEFREQSKEQGRDDGGRQHDDRPRTQNQEGGRTRERSRDRGR